jgi:hypothetical protein
MRWFVATTAVGRALGPISRALTGLAQAERQFDNLGLYAALIDEANEMTLARAPGVDLCVAAPTQAGFSDGRAYVNIIAAWSRVVSLAADYDGGVVSMSLCPPPSPENTVPAASDEAIQRATRLAWELGVVPVLAVGNWTRDDSISPWARSQYCVSVGAADDGGRSVREYSSRGAAGTTVGPTVVSRETQSIATGAVGTSFATPHVADAAMLIVSFLLTLWKSTNGQEAIDKAAMSNAVRECLRRMAQPVAGPPHAVGAGFVDAAIAKDWLATLTTQRVNAILPGLMSISSKGLGDAQQKLGSIYGSAESLSLLRCVIDTEYDWTSTFYVPGFAPVADGFIFRSTNEFQFGADIDEATTAIGRGRSRVSECAVVPRSLRGRRLFVDPASRSAFKTIAEAVLAAEPDDRIEVAVGIYRETVTLKSHIRVIGAGDVTVTSDSRAPIQFQSIRDSAVEHLKFVATGNRTSAAVVTNSESVGFLSCQFDSRLGNGLTLVMSRRVVLDDCTLKGQLQGIYAALVAVLRLQQTTITARQIGVLLYGASGLVAGCTIVSSEADGVWHIPFPGAWTREREMKLYVLPEGVATFPTAEVTQRAVGRDGLTGAVARALFVMSIAGGSVSAARMGVAAADGTLLTTDRTTIRGAYSDLAEIRNVSFPSLQDGSPQEEVIGAIQQSMVKATLVPR